MLTIKNLSFSSNGDKTHAGCTKGITIFAVPWRSVEAMNEDAAEEEYFEALTLKSVADIRKHVNSGKVELPTTLCGLSRMFNNYCRLLEVFFGPSCSHLVHARGIRDVLDEHKADLESKIMPRLCHHLLWRVHYDACQFFLACERWAPPDPLPQSNLASAMSRLVNDACIDMIITCPKTKFLGTGTKVKALVALASGPVRTKALVNAEIPAGCRRAVEALNAMQPNISLKDLIRKGGAAYANIRVGNKGDCTSFGLLGRCPGCPYRHVTCNSSPD